MTTPKSQANQATISDLKTPNRQEHEGAPVSVTLFKEALLRDDPDHFDLRLEVRDSGMFFHLRQSHASYSRLSSLTGPRHHQGQPRRRNSSGSHRDQLPVHWQQ